MGYFSKQGWLGAVFTPSPVWVPLASIDPGPCRTADHGLWIKTFDQIPAGIRIDQIQRHQPLDLLMPACAENLVPRSHGQPEHTGTDQTGSADNKQFH
jgi:hypothetical protein